MGQRIKLEANVPVIPEERGTTILIREWARIGNQSLVQRLSADSAAPVIQKSSTTTVAPPVAAVSVTAPAAPVQAAPVQVAAMQVAPMQVASTEPQVMAPLNATEEAQSRSDERSSADESTSVPTAAISSTAAPTVAAPTVAAPTVANAVKPADVKTDAATARRWSGDVALRTSFYRWDLNSVGSNSSARLVSGATPGLEAGLRLHSTSDWSGFIHGGLDGAVIEKNTASRAQLEKRNQSLKDLEVGAGFGSLDGLSLDMALIYLDGLYVQSQGILAGVELVRVNRLGMLIGVRAHTFDSGSFSFAVPVRLRGFVPTTESRLHVKAALGLTVGGEVAYHLTSSQELLFRLDYDYAKEDSNAVRMRSKLLRFTLGWRMN